jgi:hypothetical protein
MHLLSGFDFSLQSRRFAEGLWLGKRLGLQTLSEYNCGSNLILTPAHISDKWDPTTPVRFKTLETILCRDAAVNWFKI